MPPLFGKKAAAGFTPKLGKKYVSNSIWGRKKAMRNLRQLGSDFKTGMKKYGIPIGLGLAGAGLAGGIGLAGAGGAGAGGTGALGSSATTSSGNAGLLVMDDFLFH